MIRKVTKKSALTGLAVAGVLGLGIAAPTAALAHDGTEPPATAEGGEQRTERMDAMAEALADELGISKEEAATALENVREELGGHPHRGGPGSGGPGWGGPGWGGPHHGAAGSGADQG